MPRPADEIRETVRERVISNCVINLAADKAKVISEAARVLRPGGRVAVSDVIADPEMNEAIRADMVAWTGCIAGALTEAEFREGLAAAGFGDIEIRTTHRVHAHASSAIIRARRPSGEDCCQPETRDGCCEPAAKDACCGASESTDRPPARCGCEH